MFVRREGSIRLENIPVNTGARLIHRVALQRLRGLPELEIQPSAEVLALGRIDSVFDHHIRLIQTEAVAADIVGTEKVRASDRRIEIEAVVAVERKIDSRIFE